MTRKALFAAAVLAVAAQTSEAFCPTTSSFVAKSSTSTPKTSAFAPLYAEETKESSPDAVFMPPDEEENAEGIDLETVETLGRGAAKVGCTEKTPFVW